MGDLAKYKLINEQIAEVRLYYAFSREEEHPEVLRDIEEGVYVPDYRYYTFLVTMKDGRGYGFAARTPEYIKEQLEREGEIAWVELGLLVVSHISRETLLDALEKVLEEAREYGWRLLDTGRWAWATLRSGSGSG